MILYFVPYDEKLYPTSLHQQNEVELHEVKLKTKDSE